MKKQIKVDISVMDSNNEKCNHDCQFLKSKYVKSLHISTLRCKLFKTSLYHNNRCNDCLEATNEREIPT